MSNKIPPLTGEYEGIVTFPKQGLRILQGWNADEISGNIIQQWTCTITKVKGKHNESYAWKTIATFNSETDALEFLINKIKLY